MAETSKQMDWEDKPMDLKEALVDQFTDECEGVVDYLKLSEFAKEKYPNCPYAQILKDIAKEERVHRNHIKAILKDLNVTFTDEMNKMDAESEEAFDKSFL